MPTSDEIRQNISKSAENFKQTVNSFNGNWTKAPDDENWSAQQVAEHTVKAIIFFARIVSETMQSRPPEKVESEFPTKTDAIAAHESAVSMYFPSVFLNRHSPMAIGNTITFSGRRSLSVL